MRITAFDAIPVAVPDPPVRNSWGVHAPYFLRTIVRVHSDEGLTGVGETYGPDVIGPLVVERARRQLIGANPYQIQQIRTRLGVRYGGFNAPLDAIALAGAIEVACLDLIGQATGERLCDLLGGPVREEIPFSAYLFFKYAGDDDWGEILSPDTMVALAEHFVAQGGFQTIKVKGGVFPPQVEVETMHRLSERFGASCALRLDPNAVWSVETSLRVAWELERAGVRLEYLEDPTEGLAGMARVRERIDTPLATNMCVTQWSHLAPAVAMRAIDVVLSDHHFWGGPRASQELGRVCEAFGLGIGMHSNSHLGISMAAMTHVASVIPTLIAASDTHYPWLQQDVLAGGRLNFHDGKLSVPIGPGLGVTVDEDSLAAFHENYQRGAVRERDDTAELLKRDSSWLPLSPLW